MYEPTAVPDSAPSGLRGWLSQQLRAIADALARPEVRAIRFAVLHAEPERFEDGDLVVADGTDWDPGSGAGAYLRIGGAWVKQ